MNTELPDSNYRELLLWLLRKRKRLRVTGNSMLPLLQPGEEILIDPHAYQKTSPQLGDLVVTVHPWQKNLLIVKRITALAPDNRYFLEGDNLKESTDSRTWGAISLPAILGKVTSRFC